MARLPRIDYERITTGITSSTVSPGQRAAAWDGMRQALDTVAGTMDDVTVDQAAIEGAESVYRDEGGKLHVESGPVFGPAARAYRRAQQAAYAARIGSDIDTMALETRAEAKDNPEAFKRLWGERRGQFLANVDVPYKAAVDAMLDQAAGNQQRGIINANYQHDRQTFQNEIAARAKTVQNELLALAREGGVESDAYRERFAEFQGLIEEQAGNPAFAMGDVQAGLELERVRDQSQAEWITGEAGRRYDSLGPDETLSWAESALYNPDLDLTPAEREEYLGDVRRTLSARNAGRKLEIDNLRAHADDWVDLRKEGESIDPDLLSGLVREATRLRDWPTLNKLHRADRQAQTLASVSGLPLEERATFLHRLDVQRLGGSGFEAWLQGRESSGNPTAINDYGYAGLYQFGAPRLAELDLYTPGPGEHLSNWTRTPRDAEAKWSGSFDIPGYPEVRTLLQYLGSSEAQRAVFRIHTMKMDREIASHGMEKFVGQEIAGVPITRDGLYAMIHLGGPYGAKRVLTSGGGYNPKDAFGTSLLDYAASAATAGANVRSMALDPELVKSLREAEAEELKNSLEDADLSLDQGFLLDAEGERELLLLAGMARDEEQTREVIQTINRSRTRRGVAELSRQNAERQIEELSRRSGGSVGEAGVLARAKAAAEEQLAESQRLLSEDWPLYGERAELFAAQELDPADPQSFAAGIQQRAEDQRLLMEREGSAFGQPKSLLRSREANRFANLIARGDPGQAGGAIGVLTAIPDVFMLATLEQPEIKTALAGAARSNDPARFTSAMIALDSLYQRAPLSMQRLFSNDIMDRLQDWQSNLQYMGPEDLAKRLQVNESPQVLEFRQRLREKGQTLARKKDASEILDAFDPIGPFNRPGAPIARTSLDRLQVDYGNLFAERYVATQDEGAAHEQAIERLMAAWGPSVINDGRITYLPPEAYYATDETGSHDYLREDFERDLEGQLGFLPDGYALVADRQTQSNLATGKAPSYQVVIIDRDGTQNLMQSEVGRPWRYTWDRPRAGDEGAMKAWFNHQREQARGGRLRDRMRTGEAEAWRGEIQNRGQQYEELRRRALEASR